MKRGAWIWMPHISHALGDTPIHFHLSTCVGNFMIITLGELHGVSLYSSHVHEAEVSRRHCCPYQVRSPRTIEGMEYLTPEAAVYGHDRLCVKWAKRKAAKV